MNQCVLQYDDVDFKDFLKDFWNCFEMMPPENVSDEAFIAHFPAKLALPSMQPAPHPTPPLAHAPKSDPQPPTPDPSPR